MKKLFMVSGLFLGINSFSYAAICSFQGNIASVIPSSLDAGVVLDVGAPQECSCAGSGASSTVLWIDMDTTSGNSLFSAALSAKVSKAPVYVTIVDGTGQGTPGNDSVTYRFWADCKIEALQLL